MSMLNQFFDGTDLRPSLRSAYGALVPSDPNPPLPGSYNEGLLSITDTELSSRMLQGWSPIVGKKATAIAFTGFGDVFYWTSTGVYFLEVQRGSTEFIDSEAAWVFSEFLINPDVLEKVLRRPQFYQVRAAHGPLSYPDVFILEPWLMLGGADETANYKKGKVDVYLDLVAQTLPVKK